MLFPDPAEEVHGARHSRPGVEELFRKGKATSVKPIQAAKPFCQCLTTFEAKLRISFEGNLLRSFRGVANHEVERTGSDFSETAVAIKRDSDTNGRILTGKP